MTRPGLSGGQSPKRRAVIHLESCRRRLIPRVSQVEAAHRAGISRQYWEEIVAGRKKRRGTYYTVEPPYETIMAMATAVGAEHRVGQILGIVPPDEPEPQLVVVLQSEGERRVVEAILRQLRQAAPPAGESVHTLGGLRAG